MEKVILKNRATKEIKLPESGATLEIYASLLIGDLQGIDKDEEVIASVKMLAKLIKSWNIYTSEKDEKPVEINEENIKNIPLNDLNFLMEKVKDFVVAEKKD